MNLENLQDNLQILAQSIINQTKDKRAAAYLEYRKRLLQFQERINSLVNDEFISSNNPARANDEIAKITSVTYACGRDYSEITRRLDTYRYEANIHIDADMSSINTIIEELKQISKEMCGMKWDVMDHWIEVTTNEISLQIPNTEQTVNLGRFVICLFYENLQQCSNTYDYYTIKALSPHYPLAHRNGSRSINYIHPHINDGKLCEGEASRALALSLKQFRLCDFFLLVNAVLNNYNPSDPYYKLELWDHTQCKNCGNICSEDELVKCSYCTIYMCETCKTTRTCSVCNKTICSKHKGLRVVKKCAQCEEYLCLRHYKSIRKHSCFKDIKKDREEKANIWIKVIEDLKNIRKNREEQIKEDKTENTLQTQNQSSIENCAEPVFSAFSSEDHVAQDRSRPDNRTQEDI